MNRSILLGFITVFLCALGYACESDPQDASSERLAAAEKYADVVSLDDLWENAVTELAKQAPAERRDMFVAFMRKAFRPERLRQPMIAALVKHFTARELNALADFYGSPEGKSIVKKFAPYMADVMPAILQEVARGTQEFERELKSQQK